MKVHYIIMITDEGSLHYHVTDEGCFTKSLVGLAPVVCGQTQEPLIDCYYWRGTWSKELSSATTLAEIREAKVVLFPITTTGDYFIITG